MSGDKDNTHQGAHELLEPQGAASASRDGQGERRQQHLDGSHF
jgi:hypothetical protein